MPLPTPVKNYSGFWRSTWRDSSGKKRMRNFGNVKKVTRSEAERAYADWLREWVNDPTLQNPDACVLTVDILADKYQLWADSYYRRNGEPTREAVNIQHAIGHLRSHAGSMSADQVTPSVVKAMRSKMVESGGLCRSTVNKRMAKVRAMFKWAAQEGLLSASVWHGLQAVDGLKRGRTAAKETAPVKPVPQGHIDAVLPLVPVPVAAMIRLLLITGMRPTEVCIMRACDIDMSGQVWLYRPEFHKTQHHGKTRNIALGPKAQSIVNTWLQTDLRAYLFRSTHHKATLDRYNRNSLLLAVRRACERAEVPKWSPGRLRHNAATALRSRYGLEAAKVILGHSKLETTQIYAEANWDKACEIMAQVG